MIRIWLLFIGMLLSVLVDGQDRDSSSPNFKYLSYPSPGEVEQYFNGRTGTVRLVSYQVFEAEKRPKGWFIVLKDLREDVVVNRQLIWSIKTKDFVKPVFKSTELNNSDEKTLDISGYERYLFNKSPYYGYKGWSKDVISEYQYLDELPDTMLYAVGRAFSNEASELLRGHTETSTSPTVVRKEDDSIPKEAIQQYHHLRHSAQDFFYLAYKKNPALEVFVGSIYNKWCNEWMTAFLDLRYLADEKEASQHLKPGLYTRFMRSIARNYLSSCPKNSILFTNGDNDTYPLLYVQAIEGFRCDVMVVNLSLLNLSKYAELIRNDYLESPGVDYNLPLELVASDLTSIVLNSDSDQIISLTEFLNSLSRDETILYSPKSDAHYLTTSFNIDFEVGSSKMQWSIPENYIARNGAIFLSILESNLTKRPICIARTVSSDMYFGLETFFEGHGLVYSIGEERHPKSKNPNFIGGVNTERMYQNLVRSYEWEGLDSLTSRNDLRFVLTLRLAYAELAEALSNEEKLEQAKETLDHCLRRFSNERAIYGREMILLAEQYYAISDDLLAEKILDRILKGLPRAEHKSDYPGGQKQLDIDERVCLNIEFLARQNDSFHLRDEAIEFIMRYQKLQGD